MALFGFLIALLLLIVPLVWQLVRLCLRGRAAPPAPPPSRVKVAGLLIVLGGCTAIGGAAAVIASGPKLFGTVRKLIVRARARSAQPPHAKCTPKPCQISE